MNRPGTRYAQNLLNSNLIDDWQAAKGKYSTALAHISALDTKHKELVSLDHWVRCVYPTEVLSRGHLTLSDLVKIMQWKLLRGKDRPMLQNLIRQNTELNVNKVSRDCLTLLAKGPTSETWDACIVLMTSLRGVGPATASAILAPLDGTGAIPFMADEVLEACTKTKRTYTIAYYRAMKAGIDAKASALNHVLSPAELSDCLWAHAICSIYDIKGEEPPKENGRKRKAGHRKT